MIIMYIIKQEGLYQNKVNSSLFSNCNFKVGYCETFFLYIYGERWGEGFISPCTV